MVFSKSFFAFTVLRYAKSRGMLLLFANISLLTLEITMEGLMPLQFLGYCSKKAHTPMIFSTNGFTVLIKSSLLRL